MKNVTYIIVVTMLILTGCASTRGALAYSGPVITEPMTCPNGTTLVEGARVKDFACKQDGNPWIQLVDESILELSFVATKDSVTWISPWHTGKSVDRHEFNCRIKGENPNEPPALFKDLDRKGTMPMSGYQTITLICEGDADLIVKTTHDP